MSVSSEGLTEQQIRSRASRRAFMLLMLTYGVVFLLCLIALIVCWNVIKLTTDQQDGGVIGLLFAPIVPAGIVSGAYYMWATWGLGWGKDDDEEEEP